MTKNLTRIRNERFLRACSREIEASPAGEPLTLSEITRRALLTSPGAYHISYGYALRRLREYRSGRRDFDLSPQWAELSQRVAALQLRHGISDREALRRELEDGSPSRFYMTETYANRLYQRLRHRRRPNSSSTDKNYVR